MMRGRAWVRAVGAILLAVGVGVVGPTATAAPPQIERVEIDETFDDEFLSEACGVPVVTRSQGHVIDRAFATDGTGLQLLRTLNLTLTATHDGNTVRFKDVGADSFRVTPDGTVILSIIGQVPFDFTGVLKIDFTTGDVIQEPQHFTGDTTEACAILTS